MRIAVFTDLFLENTGGIPSAIKAQKTELEKMGHEVTVFCPGFRANNSSEQRQKKHKGDSLALMGKKDDVVIVPTRGWRINGAPMAKCVKKVMEFVEKKFQMSDFDVVHVHYELSCSIAGVLLAKKYKIPVVQTMHGREDMALMLNIPAPLQGVVSFLLNIMHKRYLKHRVLAKRILKMKLPFVNGVAQARMWEIMIGQVLSADVVMTPSKHFAKKIEEILKSARMKKDIIPAPNGIDERFWQNGVDFKTFDGTGPLELIWNSRISKEKRIMVVLEAIKMVNEQVGAGKIRMTVYGDGNQESEAKDFVKKNGLDVVFRGRHEREKIFAEMRKMDLAIMASNGFDTQGMTLVEAQLQGLPVMFCDPDMAEVVPENGGILTKGPEARDFANALLEILEKPEKIEDMSVVMNISKAEVLMQKRILPVLDAYKTAIEMDS